MSEAEPSRLLVDGAEDAPLTVALAHGAGAPMESGFMNVVARGLAARGLRVARFEFPYMARRRSGPAQGGKRGAPDPPRVLEETSAVVRGLAEREGADHVKVEGLALSEDCRTLYVGLRSVQKDKVDTTRRSIFPIALDIDWSGTAEKAQLGTPFELAVGSTCSGFEEGVSGLEVQPDGTLYVTTVSSTWAFELQRMEGEIRAKLAAAVGEATPPALRFAPRPVPSPGADDAAPPPRLAPTPAEEAEAAGLSASIADPELRDAVRRAVAASLARGRSGRGL